MATFIGEMNKRITLQYPIIVKDAMGSPVTTWNDAATVWAKKTTHRSDEAVQAMATTGIQIHNFRIQFRTDVKNSWRIKQGNAYFAIIAPPIEVIDGVMKYLDITVKEAK